MDLESEEEEHDVDNNQENDVEEVETDEKNTSHCMEELWEGGKIFPSLLIFFYNSCMYLQECSCHLSPGGSVPGSCRWVDIIIIMFQH